MLRDMTIGQFYPAESVIHRLDPRVKVVGVLAYLISLFLFRGFVGYAVVTVFLGTVIVLSKVPLRYIVRGMKPILFLLIVTALFNLFSTMFSGRMNVKRITANSFSPFDFFLLIMILLRLLICASKTHGLDVLLSFDIVNSNTPLLSVFLIRKNRNIFSV